MDGTTTNSGRHVVRVEVDGSEVALDFRFVREVLGGLDVTNLPSGRGGLVGVVGWNGRAVSVLDLGVLLGLPSRSRRERLVLVDALDSSIAIPVDRVHEPMRVDDERSAHAVRMAHASMEVDVGGRTLALFDPESLLRTLDTGRLSS